MNPGQLSVCGMPHPQMCNPYMLFIIYRRLHEKHKEKRKKEIAIEKERKRSGNTGSWMWMQKEFRINGQPQVNPTQVSNCWHTAFLGRHRKLNLVKVLVLLHKCYIPIKGSLIASLRCQVLYLHFPSLHHIPAFLAEICLDNFAFRIRKFLRCPFA